MGSMTRYITREEAVLEFERCGEVWYELDEIDGGGATCVSESCGDMVDDVIETRKYFVLESVNV